MGRSHGHLSQLVTGRCHSLSQLRLRLLRGSVGSATSMATAWWLRALVFATSALHSTPMDLRPEDLAARDRYKLMIGCIVPRPIAFVSTLSPDGRPNLASFSYFNGVGSDPMTLLFCPANKPDGTEKDTLRNCKPLIDGGTG